MVKAQRLMASASSAFYCYTVVAIGNLTMLTLGKSFGSEDVNFHCCCTLVIAVVLDLLSKLRSLCWARRTVS